MKKIRNRSFSSWKIIYVMSKIASSFLFSILIFLEASSAVAGPGVATYESLLQAIRETRAASQSRIETAVEQEKVREAWETGKLIDEHVLQHKERADYGEQVVIKLARDLGTSETELKYMLQFARAYPIRRPADELTWSHYEALLSLNDPGEREEVAKEAVRQRWNRDRVREEVRRRQHRTQASAKFPEITPGPLYTYRIIRLKDHLKIDLGFGVYLDLPEKDARKFKEGDMVQVRRDKRHATSKEEEASGIRHLSPVTNKISSSDLFTYPSIVTQTVDGDTFHALIDLGFGITLAQRVRLRRIDAPEILTADGKEAKAYLEKILARDKGRMIIQSHDLDQHGRPLADVWVKGKPVDQELFDQGLAVRLKE